LNEWDLALLNSPQVNTTVSPVSKKQIEGATRSTEIIARTKLRATTLKRFLNYLREIKIKIRSGYNSHYLAFFLVVFLATIVAFFTTGLRFALALGFSQSHGRGLKSSDTPGKGQASNFCFKVGFGLIFNQFKKRSISFTL
jgi:hypothetical protein